MKIRLAAIAALVLSLTGCGYVNRIDAHVTGYAKQCIDGVSYIQFTSGASVQYDTAGKVVRCAG